MPARGKSNSPSRTKGRSASPSKKGVQGTSPSGMRARSNSPSARLRARSGSPSRMRARSGSPSRMRARSGSPSKLRGRSTSPSKARGRSSSPSRATGRSSSPSGQRKGRSTSPERRRKKMGAMNKISNSFRRMRKGDRRPPPKLDENGNPIPRKKRKIKKNLGKAYKRSTRRLGKSMRRIAPKETCSYTKIASYVIPIILLIGSAIGLVIATGNVEKLKPEILDDLIKILNNKDILESDPFAGGGSPLLRWDNGGSGGLNIEILRAVSANWETTFEDAVFDWDNGNPNAVTLTTVPIAYEFNCDQVIGEYSIQQFGVCRPSDSNVVSYFVGKIKVCDGDYGETKWRGINEFTQDTSTGFIVSSSAKMNDFYLLDAGEDARLYTMCHGKTLKECQCNAK